MGEDPEDTQERKEPGKPQQKLQSSFPGVTWDSQRKKWQGHVCLKSRKYKICESKSAKECAAKLHKWVDNQIKKLNKYLIPGFDHTKDQVDEIGIEMMEEAGFDPKYSYLAKRRADRKEALKEAGVSEDEEVEIEVEVDEFEKNELGEHEEN